MSDQRTLYRKTGPCIHGFFRAHRHVRPVEGDEQACDGGRFVVAEPCEHGNYARHPIEDMFTVATDFSGDVMYRHEFCDGKPKEGNDE